MTDLASEEKKPITVFGLHSNIKTRIKVADPVHVCGICGLPLKRDLGSFLKSLQGYDIVYHDNGNVKLIKQDKVEEVRE